MSPLAASSFFWPRGWLVRQKVDPICDLVRQVSVKCPSDDAKQKQSSCLVKKQSQLCVCANGWTQNGWSCFRSSANCDGFMMLARVLSLNAPNFRLISIRIFVRQILLHPNVVVVKSFGNFCGSSAPIPLVSLRCRLLPSVKRFLTFHWMNTTGFPNVGLALFAMTRNET